MLKYSGGRIPWNDEDQSNLLFEIVKFKKSKKSKDLKKKCKRRDSIESLNALYEGREIVCKAF